VFLDIQLVGGSGFDLVPNVRAGAKVIFVTAHNQHAVRAFEVNALDYPLKPVKADRLAGALARVAAADAPAPTLGLAMQSSSALSGLRAAAFAIAAFATTILDVRSNAGTRDAVFSVNFAPGNYTAQVSGAGATTGVVLVEICELP
jgi:DNA-binding LytR/AlgR family response regulator